MEGCLLDLAKNEVQSLVNLVKNEAQYLCCFNNYVQNFGQKKEILVAKRDDVEKKLKKTRGVFSFKSEVLQWEREANDMINMEIETSSKKKFLFGLCPNCWWQYWRGKELAEKTQQIEGLLGRCNSNIVASRADGPGIKYFSSEKFMPFQSRESKFQDLMKALEDENCNMIGLQGMGGTGKTSMAKEVGGKLQGSKFDKVIFHVVSQPPDFKKIRGEIARDLGLTLEEGKEEEHSKTIWSKITKMEEKLLVILDDVWEKFDLIEGLGIPSSHQHKGCTVLITTRNLHVCTAMGCQLTIQLEKLTNEEALNLFLAQASINNSSRGLKGMAQKIVKHCGGVPVVIVAIARALKSRPSLVWENTLKNLENRDVNKNLAEAFKCLKLSYDNLENKEAKELFLISSLFPEDFEIPIQLLIKIGIGLGFFGKVGRYHSARSKALDATIELIDSSLLLNAEGECVKMHDLVREVALWIGDNDIQSIMDSKRPIEEDLRYLYWKNDDLPIEFDGTKLELLLIFLGGSAILKGANTFFEEMAKLKVLLLDGSDFYRISAPSLLDSLQSLKDIRTLILVKMEFEDISILGNLLSLETLRLQDCSMIELPREFLKLKKLRLLEVEECEIEMNNPFEVIERCSQLEELTFVDNKYKKEEKDAIFPNVSPLTLHRYQISSEDLTNYFEKYGSISRCFQPDDLRHLVTEATFKQLVGTAELLMLGGYKETRWKNLIPDIVSMEDASMNNLIILHLYSWLDIQCLIDTRNRYTNVTAFSKLVELQLSEMDIEDIYCGSLPSGFLEQLEIMKLKECQKLRNILFDGKLKLCNLKAMKLEDCPILTSIFQPSTARSLMQLEELIIRNCNALEYIISYKSSGGEIVNDDGDNDHKSCGSIFSKLKTLKIERCNKLKIILPVHFTAGLPSLEEICICDCQLLEYIFLKFQEEDHVMFPSLKQMELSGVPRLFGIYREPISSSTIRPSSPLSRDKSKEKLPNPDTRAFSWAQVCCFLHKSRTTIKEINVAASQDRLLDDRTIPISGLHILKKWFDTANMLMRQLFKFRHVKKMNFTNLSLNSESLFTLSIASEILWEELTIKDCVGLKNIITSHADDYNDQINNISIFPKLEELEIRNCKGLEFLFLSKISVRIEKLRSLTIEDAPLLNSVVGLGKYHLQDHLSNQNQNDALQFHLPAMETLCLQAVPMLIIKYFTDLMACSDEGQLNQKTTKEVDASVNAIPPAQPAQSLSIQSLNIIKEMTLVDCSTLITMLSLPTASTTALEKLTIKRCHKLMGIVADEGDTGAHMNHNSIFPKLKVLKVSHCDALEYLFPASIFTSPKHLKTLSISDVPKLKYVFGRSHHEDILSHENQNIQIYIDFPALQELHLWGAPNLTSICPKNYCLRVLSLTDIELIRLSLEFTVRFFIDFMVYGIARQQDSTAMKVIDMRPVQSLESLTVYDSKIEVIFNVTHLDAKKNEKRLAPLTSSLVYLVLEDLSELRNIWMGSKNNLSLNNLSYLRITTCNKLEIVFSASTLRSLPRLYTLRISDCEELVHIIEEDNEESAGDHLHHQPCFPNLRQLTIERCKKMKYLFSITVSGILPQLRSLNIKEASDLQHVMIGQDQTKEMATKDVLPRLKYLNLVNLPNLISVCHGIDFQKLAKFSGVHDCPRFSFYETTTAHFSDGSKNLDAEVWAKTEQKLSSQQSSINSPNITRGTKQATKEIVEEDIISDMPKMSSASSDSKFIAQLVPIPMCYDLDLPLTEDNAPATAESFDVEEEEEGDPMMLEASVSLNQIPSSTSTKPTCGRNVQSGVAATNQQIHEAMDTIKISGESGALAIEGVRNEDINEASVVRNESKENAVSHGGQASVEARELKRETVEEELNPKMPKLASLSSDSKFIGYLTNEEEGHSVVQESSNSDKLETANQFTDLDSRKEIPATFATLQNSFSMAELAGEEVGNETILMYPQSLREARLGIQPHESTNITEAIAKGVSSETLNSSSLTSKMTIPSLVSSNLSFLPARVSTTMTTKVFEEQEEEEGFTDGLKTTRRHLSGIQAVRSLREKEHETSSHGEPFVLSPSSPMLSKTPTAIKRTPSSTPSQSSYERNVQDNVGTTDQPLWKALDTVRVSSQLVEHDVQELYQTMERLLIQTTQSTLSPDTTHDIDSHDLDARTRVENLPIQTTNVIIAEDIATPSQALEATPSSTTLMADAYSSVKGMIDISVQNMLYLEAGLRRHPQVRDWLNIKQRRVFASLFTEVTRILRTTRRGDLTEDDQNYIKECCTALKAVGFDASWLSYVYGCIENCGHAEELRRRLKEGETKASTLTNELASAVASLVLLREEAKSLDDFIES